MLSPDMYEIAITEEFWEYLRKWEPKLFADLLNKHGYHVGSLVTVAHGSRQTVVTFYIPENRYDLQFNGCVPGLCPDDPSAAPAAHLMSDEVGYLAEPVTSAMIDYFPIIVAILAFFALSAVIVFLRN